MEAWWSSLGTPLRIYYGIALVTSALLGIQLLLLILGFDADTDVDTDVDAGDGGVHVLSVRSVTAFAAGFGWGGVAATEAGWPPVATILGALAAGSFLMAGVVLLMRGLYGMRYSGTLDYRSAVGAVGNVYLPIPPSMEGAGQVEVLVQGRLRVVRAFTRAADRLPNGSRVRVVEPLDQQTLLVEPLDAPVPAATEPDPPKEA